MDGEQFLYSAKLLCEIWSYPAALYARHSDNGERRGYRRCGAAFLLSLELAACCTCEFFCSGAFGDLYAKNSELMDIFSEFVRYKYS
jgi:hypothetical protein